MIEQASIDDFDEIKALIEKANDYALAKSGYRLWTVMERVYDDTHSQLEKGDFYIIRNGAGEITSTIAFDHESEFWGSRAHDRAAIYFHKFMKDPVKAPPHEAQQLLDFVFQEAKRLGKQYVRCDTLAELAGLIKYYESLGFTSQGTFMYGFSNRGGILLQAQVN